MYADQQIFSPFKELVIMMSIYVKQNCSIYNNHSIYCENPLNTQAISLKLLSPNSKTKILLPSYNQNQSWVTVFNRYQSMLIEFIVASGNQRSYSCL